MNKITYLCFAVLFSLSFNLLGQTTEIQRVRLDFTGPSNYTRHLLLGFTPDNAASDGFDFGYDGALFSSDYLADDMNWIIEDNRYVIQGVGAFSNEKYYPLGMFLSNSGEIKINLVSLENFDGPISVYVYDAMFDTFTSIDDSDYVESLNSGDYLDRFFITFTKDTSILQFSVQSSALSLDEHEINKTSLNYYSGTKELLVKTNSATKLSTVSLYNILGKKLFNVQNINANTIKIPMANLKTNSSLIVSLSTENGQHLNKHIITGKQ